METAFNYVFIFRGASENKKTLFCEFSRRIIRFLSVEKLFGAIPFSLIVERQIF